MSLDPAVVIGCATNRPWSPRAVLSFAHMAHVEPVIGFAFRHDYTDRARNGIALDAQRVPGATHLLLVDDDHTFPPDTIKRLLAHDKEIVGAMYFKREPPYDPVPYYFTRGRDFDGLQEVGGLGMGCTLIRLDVFERLRPTCGDVPFRLSPDMGEDVYFCAKCQEAGILIHLDTQLVCGHIGEVVVTAENWRAAQKPKTLRLGSKEWAKAQTTS